MHKTATVEQLEAELRRVMDSEATVKEALDETLNTQKKRRESHLNSDKHQKQLTAEENVDELIGTTTTTTTTTTTINIITYTNTNRKTCSYG